MVFLEDRKAFGVLNFAFDVRFWLFAFLKEFLFFVLLTDKRAYLCHFFSELKSLDGRGVDSILFVSFGSRSGLMMCFVVGLNFVFRVVLFGFGGHFENFGVLG